MHLKFIIVFVALLTKFTESVPLLGNPEDYSHFELLPKEKFESIDIEGKLQLPKLIENKTLSLNNQGVIT
jgi:hypothetical protein